MPILKSPELRIWPRKPFGRFPKSEFASGVLIPSLMLAKFRESALTFHFLPSSGERTHHEENNLRTLGLQRLCSGISARRFQLCAGRAALSGKHTTSVNKKRQTTLTRSANMEQTVARQNTIYEWYLAGQYLAILFLFPSQYPSIQASILATIANGQQNRMLRFTHQLIIPFETRIIHSSYAVTPMMKTVL